MRTVDYDSFKDEIEKRKESLLSPSGVRPMRKRPRDRRELENLIHCAQLRKASALATKEYEILAPRRWRINVTHSDETGQ